MPDLSATVTVTSNDGTTSATALRPNSTRSVSRLISAAPCHIRVCLTLALIIVIAALLAPLIVPHDPDATDILNKLRPPFPMEGYDPSHLMGTDQLGRDLFSRCLYGIRVSVGIALLGLASGCLIGTTLGILSGLAGGIIDRLLMMLVDVFITVPFLLLVLVGISVFGSDMFVIVLLIGLARWESYARIVRGQVMQIREMPYVEAARALGAGPRWIALRHVLPNIASPLIVLATLNFPSILLLESSLSFLGIGVRPPTASLGSMVGDGRDHLIASWWVAVAPATTIVLITLIVQSVGDWMRDLMDVRIDD